MQCGDELHGDVRVKDRGEGLVWFLLDTPSVVPRSPFPGIKDLGHVS